LPQPLAICLEDLDAVSADARYLRCVAVIGRKPGLRLDAAGAVTWLDDASQQGELWVSADDRLILFRRAGAPEIVLSRAGRSLALPAEKPVVVIDQDEIAVAARRLRVHVHGPAARVTEPSFLPARRGRTAGSVAAAFALSAALAGGCSSCGPTVEIRDQPPAPPPMEFDGQNDTGNAPPPPPLDPNANQNQLQPSAPPPIEVREEPPAAVEEPPPPPPPPIDVRETPPDPVQ
jgi:hypothetical protein